MRSMVLRRSRRGITCGIGLLLPVLWAASVAADSLVPSKPTKRFVKSELGVANIGRTIYRNASFKIVDTRPSVGLRHHRLYLAYLHPEDLEELGDLSAIQSWNLRDDLDVGLFEIQSVADLNRLAAVAHSDKKTSHGCGQLELLEYDLDLVANPEATYPVFSTEASLPNIKALISEVREDRLRASIEVLANLGTRFHSTTSGLKTPEVVKSLMSEQGLISGLDIQLVSNSISNQQSVVARIPGQTRPDEIIIVGAHLDSINRKDQAHAPGADDNASGVATLIEMLRLIAAHQLRFERTIEFHAYGAEEVGLLGSKDLASDYLAAKKNVIAMLQLDMTAFFSDTPKIHLITTDTHINVTYDLKNLILNYIDIPFDLTTLDAGTSDHKSWLLRGYAVGFAFEDPTDFNPTYHSAVDNLSQIADLSQAVRFAGLSFGFLSHYAGLVAAKSIYDAAKSELYRKNDPMQIAIFGEKLGLFQVAVASEMALSYVHLCALDLVQTESCWGERIPLLRNGAIHGRSVFVSGGEPSVALEQGKTYRLMGFDEGHKMVYGREFSLK